MKELQTWLGNDIPTSVRGIVYLCKYDFTNKTIKVVRELLFDSAFASLNAYANIPNPESQQVSGRTYNELISNLHLLHDKLRNKEWVENLSDYL